MNHDRYVYPGTNVLMNKFNIMDAGKLETVERGLSSRQISLLRDTGVTGKFDVDHLKSIHEQVFGKIYDWAGEFRGIQVWKGGTEFAAPNEIKDKLEHLCDKIRERNYFRDMDHDGAANAMADAMSELNMIHPFREGNGRTQRAFLGQLALNAGYDLDFTKMSENDMRNASMSAARGNGNLMRYLFREALSDRIYEPGSVKNDKAGEDKRYDTAEDAWKKAGPAARKSAFRKMLDMFHKDGRGGPDESVPDRGEYKGPDDYSA